MNKKELAPHIDSLVPSLYGLAYCLIPDELQAEQLVVDAYSVFLIREKGALREWTLEGDPKSRAGFRRYLQSQMAIDLLELGRTRAAQLQSLLRKEAEKDHFFSLELSQRAALYLKEKANYSHADLEDVFALKKAQIIELLHNARASLGGVANLGGVGIDGEEQRL